MAPDPPVLSQSESKIWLDYEWRVYDQSTHSGRLLVGTIIEVVGMKKTQFGGSGDNASTHRHWVNVWVFSRTNFFWRKLRVHQTNNATLPLPSVSNMASKQFFGCWKNVLVVLWLSSGIHVCDPLHEEVFEEELESRRVAKGPPAFNSGWPFFRDTKWASKFLVTKGRVDTISV